MLPFERFKKSNTENNLWIYILTLGKEKEITNEEIRSLIFEKFGFLPGKLLTKRVLYLLRTQGYIKKERFKGKPAFSTTKKGIRELEKMKSFSQELLEKL
ncbi:MAG: PadR family transcriptional regulator [Candidatus Nealsonbacteria bacterium]|nr:MAG: PadR family transcriptional regulator [Candidatus Nealsonbacteria bacterium]